MTVYFGGARLDFHGFEKKLAEEPRAKRNNMCGPRRGEDIRAARRGARIEPDQTTDV